MALKHFRPMTPGTRGLIRCQIASGHRKRLAMRLLRFIVFDRQSRTPGVPGDETAILIASLIEGRKNSQPNVNQKTGIRSKRPREKGQRKSSA